MRPLSLHPDSRSALEGIAAGARREGDLLLFSFRIAGDPGRIRIRVPSRAASPARRDGLWRTTCFEAFLATEGGGYRELNFSPSGDWAAYDFASYRTGMTEARTAPPRIETAPAPGGLVLRAAAPAGIWRRCALAAVIEEEDGARSYWALAHPPGAPDFHHPSCFALELPPPA